MDAYLKRLTEQKCETAEPEKFQYVLDHLDNNERFAFVKMNDGEISLARGNKATVSRGDQQYNESLARYMRTILRCSANNFYIGLPCQKCYLDMHLYSKSYTYQEAKYLKNATDHINNNYAAFVPEFVKRLKTKKVVFCGSLNKGLMNLLKIPYDNILNLPPQNAYYHLTWILGDLFSMIKNVQPDVILFACGPAGRVLAHTVFTLDFDEAKKVSLYDAGSLFDPWKNPPRYHKYQQWANNNNNLEHCKFCNPKE